jgi:signal transduction histidine kinase
MSSGFTAEIAFDIRLTMAIAVAIVHHHHGKISVSSDPDYGSQFTIQLPINPSLSP